MAGRPRLLVLVASGDIWPVGPQDVQFIMPPSLVPTDVYQACWSIELIQAWKEGTEFELEPNSPMLEARRKAVRILRKVMKETEKMTGRLLGGSRAGSSGDGIGGVEAVWDTWAGETEQSTITAAECAEYLLSTGVEGEKGVLVRNHTLPAYAAHVIMMGRSDLFLADTGQMWETGDFLVRSKEERQRFKDVRGWFDGSTLGGKEIVDGFVTKSKAAMAFSATLDPDTIDLVASTHSLPEWSIEELEIIGVLLIRLYEVRATQVSPAISLSYLIMKAVDGYEGQVVDQELVKRFLVDIGMLPAHDSLERSRTVEADKRNMALRGVPLPTDPGSDELLRGTELDDLREDFTDHQVFVIDDATASELDDGISIEHIPGSSDKWVHVHVADPTRYLHPNHRVATAASFQGSSVYAPEGSRPLLPLDVIMKELSLGADVERQAVLTLSALLDDKGEVKDEKVRMGWIKSPRVVTYAAVNQALSLQTGGSGSLRPLGAPVTTGREIKTRNHTETIESDLGDLQSLHDLVVKHRTSRYTSSGFEWSTPSPSLHILTTLPKIPENIFDPHSLPSASHFFPGKPLIDFIVPSASTATPGTLNAQAIVAECMILAGKIAASFCDKHNIPAPFRGTSSPKPINSLSGANPTTSLDSLLGKRDSLGILDPYEIYKSNLYLPPGECRPTITPHWIMGLNGYLRATSPLRRFDDLIVHWQIKSFLAGKKGISVSWSTFTEEEIAVLGKRMDVGQKTAKRASLNANDWWISRLVADRLHGPLGEGYTATPEMVDLRSSMVARVAGPAGTNVIDGQVGVPISLEVLATLATVWVPKASHQAIGELVNVRVTDVDLEARAINTSLVK
jgi:exoribonuclease-2